jgi:hypothetical protein
VQKVHSQEQIHAAPPADNGVSQRSQPAFIFSAMIVYLSPLLAGKEREL